MHKNLHLLQLSLWQFKNHDSLQVHSDGVQALAFVGANGRGKTNILDAIHYLCMTKSMFAVKDSEVVQWGREDGARLDAKWRVGDKQVHSAVVLPKTQRKELWIDALKTRASAYLGRFPLVIIAPNYIELIEGGAAMRRKFLNVLLAQLNPDYLENLSKYEKLLAQKNALLKQNPIQQELLDIYHTQLEPLNAYIYQARKQIFPQLAAKLQEYLQLLLPNNSLAYRIQYESMLHTQSYQECLQQYREAEYAAMRSLFGVHKDELGLYLGEHLFRSVASQGEKKTLLLALKLTEYALLSEFRRISPLLLLDDVFDKLDDLRLESMQELLAQLTTQTQLFITDVDARRSEKFLQAVVGKSYKIHEITHDKLG